MARAYSKPPAGAAPYGVGTESQDIAAKRGAGSEFAARMAFKEPAHKQMCTEYAGGFESGKANARRKREDLLFLLGRQWTSTEETDRKGRPTLVDNKLPPAYHQIKNDIRQNIPAPKLKPRGDAAVETALKMDGL